MSSDSSTVPIESEGLVTGKALHERLPVEMIDKIMSHVPLNDRILYVPYLGRVIHDINKWAHVDETTNKMLKIIPLLCPYIPELQGSEPIWTDLQKMNLWAMIECTHYFRENYPKLLKPQRNGSIKVRFMNIFWELLKVTAKCRESLDALPLSIKEEIIKFLIDLGRQSRYHFYFNPDDGISQSQIPEDLNLRWGDTIDEFSLSPYMVFPFMYSYLLDPEGCSDNLIADINMDDSNVLMPYLMFSFLNFIKYVNTSAQEMMSIYQKLNSWILASLSDCIVDSLFAYMKSCLRSLRLVDNSEVLQRKLLEQGMPIFTQEYLSGLNKNRLKALKQCLCVCEDGKTEGWEWNPFANELNFHAFIEHLITWSYIPLEHDQITGYILFDNVDELDQVSYEFIKTADFSASFARCTKENKIFTMFRENSFEKCLFLLSFLSMDILFACKYYSWNKVVWIIINDVEVRKKCFEYVRDLPFRNMLFRELCSWRIFEILSLNTIPDILLKELVEFKNSQKDKKEFFDYLALCAPTCFLWQMIYHIKVFSHEDQKEISARLLLLQLPSSLATCLVQFLKQLYLTCDAAAFSPEEEKVKECIKKVFNCFNEEDGNKFKKHTLDQLRYIAHSKFYTNKDFFKPLIDFITDFCTDLH